MSGPIKLKLSKGTPKASAQIWVITVLDPWPISVAPWCRKRRPILSIPILHLFIYQIYNFNFKDSKNSLKIFKANNLLGAIILINIFIGKV